MRHVVCLGLAATLLMPAPCAGQATHVQEGDRLYAARDATAALAKYEAAVAGEPANYEALWKASRSATDLGEFETDKRKREALYTRARDYASRAVAANPTDAIGHFELSKALGRVALSSGVKERVRLAGEVRTEALEALARSPEHPGALHIIGMWNAEIMRLSSFQRLMAKTFMGGKVLGEANWAAAVQHLERAMAIEPDRIVHRLDLGHIYKDTGKKSLARAMWEWIARAPVTDYNDPHYKRLAAQALRDL
jgi:tetratricopeptide (TPR) repeat protein